MHIRLQAILYKAQELHMDYRSFLILLLIGWTIPNIPFRNMSTIFRKYVYLFRKITKKLSTIFLKNTETQNIASLHV